MIVEIENLLTADVCARFRSELANADWADGRATAGYQSALAKDNLQLPEGSAVGKRLGEEVLAALSRNLLFQSAALPAEVFPPLFNLYRGGHAFGAHIDNAFRAIPGSGRRLRTDLSATLFLADPGTYDGGELMIEDTYGSQAIKLPAGSMIIYPATSVHSVNPVTRGERIASFFWVQSLVAEDSKRALLFDLDLSLQGLRQRVGDKDPAMIALTGCYHNLLRLWASG